VSWGGVALARTSALWRRREEQFQRRLSDLGKAFYARYLWLVRPAAVPALRVPLRVDAVDITVNPPGREGMRKSATLLSVQRGRRGRAAGSHCGDRGAFGCVLPVALTGL
jgi:hypothetical protein